MPTTILIALTVEDAQEISPGVFKTDLTNSKLEGNLSFIHGSNNRDVTLSAIKENLFSKNLSEIISLVGDLTNGKGIGKSNISAPIDRPT